MYHIHRTAYSKGQGIHAGKLTNHIKSTLVQSDLKTI